MAHYKKKSDTDPSSPNKGVAPTYSTSSPGSSWPPPPPETGARSQLPGEGEDSNSFRKVHPRYLRPMYEACPDPERKRKIWRALKEWSRQYTDSLIKPYKYEKYFVGIENDYGKTADRILKRMAEVADPQRNLFYYQDAEPSLPGSSVNYTPDPTSDAAVEPDLSTGLEKNVNTETGNMLSPTESAYVHDLRIDNGYNSGPRTGGLKVSDFFDTFVWASDEALDSLFTSKKPLSKKHLRL
jgi:hypothetical protein